MLLRMIAKLLVCLILLSIHSVNVLSDQKPGLKEVDCWFENTSSIVTVCYHHYFNENPNDKSSRIIQSSVVIFKSDSKNKKGDPVLYLQGGPGQAYIASEYIGWIYRNKVLKYWLKDREVIFTEYRGLGLSEPSLKCSDLDHDSLLAKTYDDWYKTYQKCHSELLNQSADLPQYHALNVVEDLIKLRSELEIKQWNLWGHSYGSMIAMLLADKDNDHVRSIVTEGVWPPRFRANNLSNSYDFINLLERHFDLCRSIFYCNNSHTDLNQEWVELLVKLNKDPIEIRVNLFDVNYNVQIDDSWFIDIIFNSIYWKRGTTHIPFLIEKTSEGDFSVFSKEFSNIYKNSSLPLFSYGALRTFGCNETNILTQQELENSELPTWLKEWYHMPDYCEIWIGKTGKSVLSDISISFETPILFLSGLFDPVTPAKWTEEILDDFKNGQRFLFSEASDSFTDDKSKFCIEILKSEFIDHPMNRIDKERCEEGNIKYPEDWRIGLYPEKWMN